MTTPKLVISLFVLVILISVLASVFLTSKKVTTPPGCYYKDVQCFQAPCDPILVCPDKTVSPSPIASTSACKIGGCSNQLCFESEEDGLSTCIYAAEYACYKLSTCERQSNGKCGWTPNPNFSACLQNPPAL